VKVTFQQVQKVKNGANRISASRLFEMAIALGVPVGALFDGLPAASRTASPRRSAIYRLSRFEGRACLSRLTDRKIKQNLHKLILRLAGDAPNDAGVSGTLR
jgi:transcriptional regulator with XRE-family HTH domain